MGCLGFGEFAGGYWWWLCAMTGMGIGEGIIPVLLMLTAPDTRPRIPGQPVLTHKWELAGCEQCQRHDEKQVHRYKLAWGICLRICNEFLLQCSCDFFLLTFSFFFFNSYMIMSMTVQTESCYGCWEQMFEWKLSRWRGWVVSGRELFYWTSPQTQIFNLWFPEPCFLLSVCIYLIAVWKPHALQLHTATGPVQMQTQAGC